MYLLRVVKTARPVDADVRHVVVELDRAVDGGSGVRLQATQHSTKTGRATLYRRKHNFPNGNILS